MNKTTQDVINEWVKRGYITQQQATENADKYNSYIEQSKDSILAYCNIPLKANMPDGLFFVWVEMSYSASKGVTLIEGGGAIKSISEGDTTITYDVGTSVVKDNSTVVVDYKSILNRYRRLP